MRVLPRRAATAPALLLLLSSSALRLRLRHRRLCRRGQDAQRQQCGQRQPVEEDLQTADRFCRMRLV
jgi:hypothetical protein